MKAILILDMPSDCNHCQFADFGNGQWECNQRKGKRIGESMKISSTPSWCPLKPMPEKKEEGYPNDDYTIGKADGWNECLYEILGEENVSSNT